MISIIIPVYNEEQCLRNNDIYYQTISKLGELIFVDGGSTDNTAEIADRLGRFISAPKGRARQMNKGAEAAQYDILLFLHADSKIHIEHLKQIVPVIQEKEICGGCFSQVLDKPGLLFRWIAWVGNIRARLTKIFYGDQGIFVRKDVFWKIGGYPEVPICEDILITKMLRTAGKTKVLRYPILCSARRWEQFGIFKTFLLNLRVYWKLMRNKDLAEVAVLYQDVR